MNNQSVRSSWKLIEDYPTRDGNYLVAFEDPSGEFWIEDCEVWGFYSREWHPLGETSQTFPSFYIDLPMPKTT